MKQEVLKIIDWPLSVKLANDSADVAEELFGMLITELPIARKDINDSFTKKNYDLLHQHVHKLYGATCYCGVPRLKALTLEILIKLKTNDYELEHYISAVNKEIELIIQEHKKDNYRQ